MISLDIETLLVMTAAMTLVTGALLLLTWLPHRDEVALALWGAGCVACGTGLALAALRTMLPELTEAGAGAAFMMLGYALLWAGARRFDGHPLPVAAILATPFVGFGFTALSSLGGAFSIRLAVVSAAGALFFGLTALDFWRGRAEPLVSRMPAVILTGFHAAALVVRAVLQLIAPPTDSLTDPAPWTAISLLEGTLVLIAASFLLLAMSKERVELQARHAATHDPLTGLGNRRAFLAAIEGARHACLRAGAPLSLVMVDLDHFKAINDRHGHPAGDRALCAFTDAVAALLGPSDMFARLGGDEFAILLPRRDAAAAVALVDRLRPAVATAARDIVSLEEPMSISAGVATMRPGLSVDGLFAEADQALYEAKKGGRDRVVHGTGATVLGV